MKKKLLVLVSLLSMATIGAIGMAACGESGGKTDDTSSPTTSETTSETTTTKYSITFKDENGNTLAVKEVAEGKTPDYVYNKQDTAEWDYSVLGWSTTQGGEILSSLPTASEDVTYYAIISKKKQVYTINYISNGDTIDSASLEYGATLSELPTPKLDGHKFVCWCSDETLTTPVSAPVTVTGNQDYYAQWNKVIDIKTLLSTLLSDYQVSPYSYIPETMTGTYSKNLINPNQIVTDYSANVQVSQMLTGGFGEQWNMVLTNLSQSMLFFNSLSVVESISAASITAFNNYFDSNPSDTAHHNFMSGIYSVTVNFDGETIAYVLDYTANIPVLGEQTVQIYMDMSLDGTERNTRIQLGDANALTYKMTENSYEFAIKYLGVRRAFFSIERDEEGNCTGHIYEHLSYEGVGTHSAADFYITEDYVSVVGNKADAFIGFTGYIDEVYSVQTGKMLGYEIRETLSSITYNTLWFNLDQIDGINSIRYQTATEETAAAFYINGSTKAWENKLVGGFGLKMLSRRFDIEFRTQYFYSYDATTEEYTQHAVQVPMFFVQEENFDTVVSDVKSTNSVNITLDIATADLEKIQADYKKYIDVFIANKELVTEEVIIAYIGEKVVFE